MTELDFLTWLVELEAAFEKAGVPMPTVKKRQSATGYVQMYYVKPPRDDDGGLYGDSAHAAFSPEKGFGHCSLRDPSAPSTYYWTNYPTIAEAAASIAEDFKTRILPRTPPECLPQSPPPSPVADAAPRPSRRTRARGRSPA
jgi:hypothetical protein